MEKDKTEAIIRCPAPQSVKGVRSFMGMVNFYRTFIQNFSKIAVPITRLTRKNVPFVWNEDCQKSFEMLKEIISKDIIMLHPSMIEPFLLFTDASDAAIGSVLVQKDNKGVNRPLEFYSRKLLDAELNYSVYDKELLAIVESFKNWRHFLIHSNHVVEVYSDHNNLRYFRSSQLMKPRHARWAEFLSQFSFRISHIAGKENVVADYLSRSHGEMNNSKQEFVLLDDKNWTDKSPCLTNRLAVAAVDADVHPDHDWPEDVAQYLDSEDNSWPCSTHTFETYKNDIKNFSVIGDKLYFSDQKWKRLYLPQNQRLLACQRCHDELGHLGYDSTIDLLKRRYYWPTLVNDYKNYIKECSKCQLARGSMSKPNSLQPIPPVGLPFERWGIDFLQNLPPTKLGNRHIITCIDYSTRWVVASAVAEMTADSVIQFLYSKIFMQFGVPFEIISDRGAAFLSESVSQFLHSYSVRHLPSSSYHPQTNGMVESMHRMFNHSITTSVNQNVDRWDEFVDKTVFALRVRTHSVTKYSPYKLVYGLEPRLFSDMDPPVQVRAPWTEDERRTLNLERTAEGLEELGEFRAAAYKRSLSQAQRMKGIDTQNTGFKFEINDWVKKKNFRKTKFQNSWTGPFIVVEHGYPFTYWLIGPDGIRLDSLVNESHLKPWISHAKSDTEDFDGIENDNSSVIETASVDSAREEENRDNSLAD
jgi:hypothetical protein